jgi:hypothetical protein
MVKVPLFPEFPPSFSVLVGVAHVHALTGWGEGVGVVD